MLLIELVFQLLLDLVGRSIKFWGLVAGVTLGSLAFLHPDPVDRTLMIAAGVFIVGFTTYFILRDGFFE